MQAFQRSPENRIAGIRVRIACRVVRAVACPAPHGAVRAAFPPMVLHLVLTVERSCSKQTQVFPSPPNKNPRKSATEVIFIRQFVLLSFGNLYKKQSVSAADPKRSLNATDCGYRQECQWNYTERCPSGRRGTPGERVCGSRTLGSNPSLSAINLYWARPCATKDCEPRQAWKGATVSRHRVCRR
jgi:hypothetical protein